MARLELAPAVRLTVDGEPDERGNLSTAAVLQGGRLVALTLNAN